MNYIPEDVRWFIAELVEEIVVEGDPRNVVHRNLVLIEASSAEEAYEKSLRLGLDSNTSYDNPDGKKVQVTFRGVLELNVIGKELVHGTEVLFRENIGVTPEQVRRWVVPKERLSAFRPIETSSGPNYVSAEIMEEVRRVVRKEGKD